MANSMRASAVAGSPKNVVDLQKIFQIESSLNPRAVNNNSGARGLGQITPIVLKEWNNMNPTDQHLSDELFDPSTNAKISGWYMNKRIPQMIKHYGLEDNIDNRLAAYNAGIGTVKNGGPLPTETVNYIRKYKELQ